MGNSKKISIHHDGQLFGILRARGVLWTGILKAWRSIYIWNSEGLNMLVLWTLPVCKCMKLGRPTWHWWWPRKCRIQEKQWSIWHELKKADKTWFVHQIHEFLDGEYQINKIRTDLCSRMKFWSIFLNPGVQLAKCESQSSLADSSILRYDWSRIGRDCWPCRLKFVNTLFLWPS